MTNQSIDFKAANEHVQRFAPMIGLFAAEVRFWMSGPEPSVSHGTMSNTWDLNGAFMKQVFEGSPESATIPGFAGRGYFGYNTTDNRYEGFWIDTASTMMQHEFGSVDNTGLVWEMRSELTHPQSKQRIKKRSIISIVDHNQHTIDSSMQIGEATEFRVMQIDFKRSK